MAENNANAKNNGNDKNNSGELEKKVNDKLKTEHGTTTIEDNVVSKIAGIAAREVSGVAALGGGGARVIGSIRETLGASENVRQGVSVEVEEGSASIDIAIIAEYGVAIHELAEAIRRNIINAVERMTGLEAARVDVTVHDVRLPHEEDDSKESKGSKDSDQAAISSGKSS